MRSSLRQVPFHFPIGLTFPLVAFRTVRFSVEGFNVTRSTARTNPSLDSAGSHHCKDISLSYVKSEQETIKYLAKLIKRIDGAEI